MNLILATSLSICAVVLLSCGREEVTPVELDKVFHFAGAGATTLYADGVSSIIVEVQLDGRTDSSIKEVKFVTTLGTFPGGSQTETALISSEKRAVIVLKAGRTIGTAHITASVASLSITRDIEFVVARPDALLLSLSEYTVDSGSTNAVMASVQLYRDIGTPTSGQKVFFSYTPVTDSTQLVMQPFAQVDNDAKCTLDIANPFGVSGTFQIVARAFGQNGDTLTASRLLIYH